LDAGNLSLHDLVAYNSTANLTGDDAVYCGTCKAKTSQKVSRSYNPDLCLMEVIRVTKSSRNVWGKSNASLSFSVTNLVLPGFERSFRVVGTCHHRGGLNSGHWITKVCTNLGWFELDDLRGDSFPTIAPGINDDSVALILAIAEDKLRT
jgi:ubiquitin C-terminal hydrolase